MPEQTRITKADVEHVAALASLALSSEELDSLGGDLSSILGYVAELQAVDTTGVEPLTHVSELFHVEPARTAALSERSSADPLRADAPTPSLPRATVMENAPATDGTFFKVPKVIER